jgi:predicted phosphodiesterase
MNYQYPHFIKENIAPSGARRILVCAEDGREITGIPLGGLTPPRGQPLYSFGLVSDIHLYDKEHSWVTWDPNTKFDNALSYFEEQGCAMCIVCGDLTQTGFYVKDDDSDEAEVPHLDEGQMAKYQEVCAMHQIPVYELAGNHECYHEQPITQNLDKWETYTGKRELSYALTQGDDLFILLGQPRDHSVMSDEDFQWFEQTLESNRDKRCFVFVHSYLEEDSGDPGDHRENSIFDGDKWGEAKTAAFVELLRRYPNVILFHGHSHMKFECQAQDKAANYTEKNGFKSVHIPSLGRPRSIAGTQTPYADGEAQGYIVDVYEDFIVLCGMDLIHNLPVSLGMYKIQ